MEPMALPSGWGAPSAGSKLSLNQLLRKNTVMPVARAMAASIVNERRRKVDEFMVSA